MILTTKSPNDNEIGISNFSITYYQNADTNSDEIQLLTLTAEDNGTGWYASMKIENKWSFDDPSIFTELIQDFWSKFYAHTKEGWMGSKS